MADTPYLAWLRSVAMRPLSDYYGPAGSPEDVGYYSQTMPLNADPQSDPGIELAKYNAQDRSIDLGWGQKFLYLNDYFTNGEFAPGAPTATIEVMAQAASQWARDAEPSMLDKVMKLAAVAALAYTAYAVAAGASGAVSASLQEEMAALGVPATPANMQIASVIEAVPAADYGGYAYDIATSVPPETLGAAVNVATGTATAAQAAQVAGTGLTATELIGGAKAVIGAAGTVATVVKLATGATRINPATGAPYGLPAAYQPVVSTGDAGGLPMNFSAVLRQLALPAGILAASFLLKG